jgi:hypothetical protein
VSSASSAIPPQPVPVMRPCSSQSSEREDKAFRRAKPPAEGAITSAVAARRRKSVGVRTNHASHDDAALSARMGDYLREVTAMGGLAGTGDPADGVDKGGTAARSSSTPY